MMTTAMIRKYNRLTIPAYIMKELGMTINNPVLINVVDNKIVIEPIIVKNKRLTAEKLYRNFNSDDSISEIDWGKPQGDEVW